MTDTADPFAHHPELRDKITDPDSSFFRNFTVEAVFAQFPQMEPHRDWPYSDAEREALRAEALKNHTGDLWVFGYGSLMWNPALHFAELRRARVAGHRRRMILLDTRGGRGTVEQPGLIAALDTGGACDGLAFRITADKVDPETEILFRREMIAPGYHARFVPATLDDRTVPALTFVADHSIPDIRGDLDRQEQVTCIAYGAGFLGTSHAYLANIVSHFETLGIDDPDCTELLRDAEALQAAAPFDSRQAGTAT